MSVYPGSDRRRQDPIRVAIVDRHALFRHGLREILGEYGLKVVGEADNPERALEVVLDRAPHVVVTGLDMPDGGGVEAIRQITQNAPLTRVVVLTIFEDDETVLDAIMAGACGYLLKDATPDEIASAVRAAFGGASLISPRIGAMLLDRLRAQTEPSPTVPTEADLTERELQVLRLLAEGKDNAEIAAQLFLSTSTVKNHISNILVKLQMKNRIQAAVYAARAGLL